jgi:hypothetical protein
MPHLNTKKQTRNVKMSSKKRFSLFIFFCIINLNVGIAYGNNCDKFSVDMNKHLKSQIGVIKDYDNCLNREFFADLSHNYPGFVCDFQARQAQRGQAKLSLAAQDAHRACTLNETSPALASSVSTPHSILPQEFVAQTVAKRVLAARGGR